MMDQMLKINLSKTDLVYRGKQDEDELTELPHLLAISSLVNPERLPDRI